MLLRNFVLLVEYPKPYYRQLMWPFNCLVVLEFGVKLGWEILLRLNIPEISDCCIGLRPVWKSF